MAPAAGASLYVWSILMGVAVWYKRIRLSLELSRSDVVEIMRMGGVTITGSQADRWSRPSDDDRRGSPGMSADDFDAFTRGLVEWSKQKND